MGNTEIDLTGRATAKTLVRRLVPTQVRLSLSIYDKKTRRYLAVPGYKGLIPIESRGELLKMWRAIREAVESKGWKADDAADLSVSGTDAPMDADEEDQGE